MHLEINFIFYIYSLLITSLVVYITINRGLTATVVFILFAYFSFVIRPISTFNCDNFSPFYFHDNKLYVEGVILSNLFLFIFCFFYLLSYKGAGYELAGSGNQVIEVKSLKKTLIVCISLLLLVDIASIAIFGPSILPGMRNTGLSKAASGSQVFFALSTSLTIIGVGVNVLLMKLGKIGVLTSSLALLLLFLLSMIFYQRGAFITGILFGLFLIFLYDKNQLYTNLRRNFVLLGCLYITFVFGRQLISFLIGYFLGIEKETVDMVLDNESKTFFCSISNSAQQEHDQVWSNVITYVSNNGPDYFYNLVSALTRPFLSLEAREINNLVTSVDSLNLYSDRFNYINYNFGFSLSPIQYFYYSLADYFIMAAVLLPFLCVKFEKMHKVNIINSKSIFVIFSVYQVVMLLTSTFDETLKWCIINIIVAGLIYFFSRDKIHHVENSSNRE